MKKSILLYIATISLLFSQTATLPSGSGTIDDPYQIVTLNNLYWIAESDTRWASHYRQTADIDASATSGWFGGAGWTHIGSIYPPNDTKFTGSYNGSNYIISNLYQNRSTEYYGGLFGYIDGATIQNLGVTNVNITGYQYTGGLVGWAENNSIISHCYSTGSVNGDNETGGLLGDNIKSIVDNSYSTASVTGDYNVGGLVGYNNDYAIIRNCYSTGNVNGLSAGGLVGSNANNSTISNCFSRSNVNRSSGFGTSFGAFAASNNTNSTIEYCYSTGSVTYSGASNPSDKGFVGLEYTSPIYNSNFWDNTLSNQSSATGATSKTTAEMKAVATYTDLATSGLTTPWDFLSNPNDDTRNYNFWHIDGATNNGYPFLRQQSLTCIVIIYIVEVSDNLPSLLKPMGDESTGFIELWNDREVPLSLDGYSILRGTNDGSGFTPGTYSYPIPSGYSVPAKGFLVVGNGADLATFNADWGTALTAAQYDAGNSNLEITVDHAYALSKGAGLEQNETPEVVNGDRIHQEPGEVWIIDSPTNGSPGDFGGDVPLPVELTSFTANAILTGVQLNWTTESEMENLGFLLERRTDDTEWTEIVSYKTDNALMGQGTTSSQTDYAYLDVFVEPNTTYEYRLADVAYDGAVTYHSVRTVTVGKTPLSSKVEKFTVLPAYPNPFNPSTTITYGLDKDSEVSILIYDITGKLINTLLNTNQKQGWHSVEWNGTDNNNNQVPAGIYLSKIICNNTTKTTKLMLLK